MWETDECTMNISINNKYHEDDIINEFLEYVRFTEIDSDAIKNIPVILKWYEKKKKYTIIEKINILFS